MTQRRGRSGFLLLEDGTLFRGSLLGTDAPSVAEVVFTTNMSGYQEVFTDPSFRGQIVVMTAPMIGNYGLNTADPESAQPPVTGLQPPVPALKQEQARLAGGPEAKARPAMGSKALAELVWAVTDAVAEHHDKSCPRQQMIAASIQALYQAQKAAPPPEQPRIDGDWQAGDVRCDVERRDAVLVHWRRAGQAPCSLGIDEHLSARREYGLSRPANLLQSLSAPPPINGDLLRNDEIEPEQRHVSQLPLENDREVGRVFQQREGLEKRLMLDGDQDRAGWDIFEATIFEP